VGNKNWNNLTLNEHQRRFVANTIIKPSIPWKRKNS